MDLIPLRRSQMELFMRSKIFLFPQMLPDGLFLSRDESDKKRKLFWLPAEDKLVECWLFVGATNVLLTKQQTNLITSQSAFFQTIHVDTQLWLSLTTVMFLRQAKRETLSTQVVCDSAFTVRALIPVCSRLAGTSSVTSRPVSALKSSTRT